MKKEIRNFEISELKVETRAEGSKRVLTGHAAVFNTLSPDLGGFREQILPGAFSAAVNEDDVRALFNHDPNFVLGRNKAGTLSLSEDNTGLAVSIDPPDTQFARDLIVSVERGDITQMSFGFVVMPDGQRWDYDNAGDTIRTLTNLRLFDVSLVTYPAYPTTDIALRSMNQWQAEQKQENKDWKTDIDLKMKRLKLEE
jgi:HK97 family phage prohead protease